LYFQFLLITRSKLALRSYKKQESMGGFHRASAGKNKKVIEIFPLPAFLPQRAKE
jgi:hypothetical protein